MQDAALLAEPWVERLIAIEDRERKRRSLERRLANARIGPFKPFADFDFNWPKRIDRPLIEELFSLAFVEDATNVILVGPNGVGKTMLVKNLLLHHGVLNGLTARFTTASDRLHELAARDSDASLARRLRRFTGPNSSPFRRPCEERRPVRDPPPAMPELGEQRHVVCVGRRRHPLVHRHDALVVARKRERHVTVIRRIACRSIMRRSATVKWSEINHYVDDLRPLHG